MPLLVLAHDPAVPVLLVAMFAAGVGLEHFTIAWDLSLQQNVPGDRPARVYSYDMVGSFVAIPIGQLVAEPVALTSRHVRILHRHEPSEVAEPAP